jgi:hypothetical protein
MLKMGDVLENAQEEPDDQHTGKVLNNAVERHDDTP